MEEILNRTLVRILELEPKVEKLYHALSNSGEKGRNKFNFLCNTYGINVRLYNRFSKKSYIQKFWIKRDHKPALEE